MSRLDDAALRRILASTRVIAVVGLSADPLRPSYFVGRYLWQRGYRVIPVNPSIAGQELFGETARASLTECPPETDMVDIFRRAEQAPQVVSEAIAHLPNLRTIWLQLGIESEPARALAESRGLAFVQNRCPKIEHQRLFGELRKAGFNTGILSSKLEF